MLDLQGIIQVVRELSKEAKALENRTSSIESPSRIHNRRSLALLNHLIEVRQHQDNRPYKSDNKQT